MSSASPRSDAGSSPRLESHDDRAMIRRLLSRYSRRDIDRLLEEESREPSWYTSKAPLAPAPALGSNSLTEAATSSISSRRRQTASSPASAGSRTDYACGFCAEIGITKTCTRRNDLRRHIDQFHNTNALWLCQHPGCRMAFDWQTAYQLHLRNEHGGSQMRMDEAKVTLCPQTVFACGYDGCQHVVEAAGDAGAAAAWKAYTAHLIKHCDEGRGAVGWDYSHRMRNLLGQPRVAAAWKAVWPGRPPALLRWDPGASRTLRKLLETRHVDPLPRLVRCALALASEQSVPSESSSGPDSPSCSSSPPSPASAAADLDLPIKKLCPAAAIKHEMRPSPTAEGLGLGPVRAVMPFRALPAQGFGGGGDDVKSHPPTAAAAAAAFYGMLGTAAVFQQQLVSFRHRPVDSPLPHGGPDSGCWSDVYAPPVAGAYYDMAGSMAPVGHHGLLGAYGPSSSS
ncbi:hypothetical protein XA68_10293 [Ophiocordyceps unilateralis]|uniref:C2H2-type domain-containing protein n=1 Tax=Ophiocordyceps unilateralis TaxID=268505 RepID=A0A2A9P246_OPHUN|nr:hypothetical protein XA68_10293 [Ophiocordyceps unilateralis]